MSTGISYIMLLHPKFQGLDLNGDVLEGGMVYAYQAQTTTPMTTYNGPNLSTANAWPVVLDPNGQADIWWSGPGKLVLTDSLGNTIWTVDNLYGIGGNAFSQLPVQETDYYLVWDSPSGTFKNSGLTRESVENAVNSFNQALLTNGGVVAADVGDTSLGALNTKIAVAGGAITKSVTTDGSGNKTLVLTSQNPVGAILFLNDNFFTA